MFLKTLFESMSLPSPASHRPQSLRPWDWTAPRIAVLLFLIALGTLLWLLHRQEIEEQRATLINDMLWLEQNLDFQLSRHQEQLEQLSQDYFAGRLAGTRFDSHARSLMQNSPGMIKLLMVDDIGLLLRGTPGTATDDLGGIALRPSPSKEAFNLSHLRNLCKRCRRNPGLARYAMNLV